jgi:hypothetical protein
MFIRRLITVVSLCGALSVAFCVAVLPAVAQDERRGARAREVRAIQAGEVLVVINEQLLNAFLEGMLASENPPTFPLARGREERKEGGARCVSEVTLMRESQGTRTAVRFADGRINVPVAFRGTYEAALVGCLKFEGWADADLHLSFNQERQVLTARINVRSVQLKNVPSLVGGGITQLVQDAIDRRVNPVELLRAEQLGARIQISQGNVLRLRAREVRHEVVQRELRLRIFYEVVRGE